MTDSAMHVPGGAAPPTVENVFARARAEVTAALDDAGCEDPMHETIRFVLLDDGFTLTATAQDCPTVAFDLRILLAPFWDAVAFRKYFEALPVSGNN